MRSTAAATGGRSASAAPNSFECRRHLDYSTLASYPLLKGRFLSVGCRYHPAGRGLQPSVAGRLLHLIQIRLSTRLRQVAWGAGAAYSYEGFSLLS